MKSKSKKQKLPGFITKPVKSHSRPHGDIGTPELHRHHRIVEETREYTANGQVRIKGARVVDQLPIDRYHDRHELAPRPDTVRNEALYQAAKKLKDDFQRSNLIRRGETVFEVSPSGTRTPDQAMLMHLAAHSAYNKAILALSPSLTPILRHVVCYDGSARDWAIQNGDNPNAGLAMLRAGLTDLAAHYRMLPRR